MQTKYDKLVRNAKSGFDVGSSRDILDMHADLLVLAAALQPFVTHNSSEPTIDLRVFTSDITRARAALARLQET